MATHSRRIPSQCPKAILFDLDNTLIATRQGDKAACDKVGEILVQQHGVPENVANRIVQSFLINFRLCPARPDGGLDEWRLMLWAHALGEQYAHIASEIYQQWLVLRWHFLALQPDVKQLLARLRERFRLAIISNGPSNAQWEKIHQLNISPYFDLILVSGDLPWEKPDHRIFLEACETLGVQPADCLMVGDKLETDILGGQEASLGVTVWVPLSPASLEKKLLSCNDNCRPDHTLKSVLDLPSVLTKDSEPAGFLKAKHGPVNRNLSRVCMFDLEDTNSNASDGS